MRSNDATGNQYVVYKIFWLICMWAPSFYQHERAMIDDTVFMFQLCFLLQFCVYFVFCDSANFGVEQIEFICNYDEQNDDNS